MLMPCKILYSSTGSLIIDDIRYQDGTEEFNILGGAGVYAIYGMRLWHPPPMSNAVGYIVQQGFDHPTAMTSQLEALELSLIPHTHPDKHTTRGWNYFGANDHRDFEYQHPIIHTTPADFPQSWIDSVRMLHIISSPARAIEIVNAWRQRQCSNNGIHTQFIWEPVPWSCLPDQFDQICETAGYVDVVSPNHEETKSLLGLSLTDNISVEDCAQRFFDAIHKVVVIRAGKQGCLVVSKDQTSWVPAYWQDTYHVRDVTGAGNAFCGGFAVGWVESGQDAVEACLYGAVSASFAVEQIGTPRYTAQQEGKEKWNDGPSPHERLELLRKRTIG
ncbi:hypothetical protein DFQ28_011669 [Apophysomyces sp. BC1034]|nr:hypothetical protein DFQ30_008686 [Apophysomyces sp. BC1015]KAG0176684.1 hypothetical protein DFQ29_005836 [Apophysomyces sp. BC1021]KAG0184158.1 hypothetical protein DFQ28_011669 [Apophysomyces sp. BC1034]